MEDLYDLACEAISDGNLKSLKGFINKSNIKEVTYDRCTLLHVMATSDKLDYDDSYTMTKYLLEQGGDPSQVDDVGQTALNLAICFVNLPVLLAILEFGGSKASTVLKRRNEDLYIPLGEFITNSYLHNIRTLEEIDIASKALELMIRKGGGLDNIMTSRSSSEREPALHALVSNDDINPELKLAFAKILINMGAKVNIRNGSGDTALDCCSIFTDPRVKELIVEAGGKGSSF
jgi:ankyrin repeat protein